MLEFPRFIGWDNYSRLFLNDDVFLIALKNTLLFAVITGPVSYIACFLFAWIINELSPKIRAFMTLVFYAPFDLRQCVLHLADHLFRGQLWVSERISDAVRHHSGADPMAAE